MQHEQRNKKHTYALRFLTVSTQYFSQQNCLLSHKVIHTVLKYGRSDFCVDVGILLIGTALVPMYRDNVQLIVSLSEDANNLLISKHQMKTPYRLTKMGFYPLEFFLPVLRGKVQFLAVSLVLYNMEDVCLCKSFMHSMELKLAGPCWGRFFWSVLWERLSSGAWPFIQVFEVSARLFFDLYLILNFLMVEPGQNRVNLSPPHVQEKCHLASSLIFFVTKNMFIEPILSV